MTGASTAITVRGCRVLASERGSRPGLECITDTEHFSALPSFGNVLAVAMEQEESGVAAADMRGGATGQQSAVQLGIPGSPSS